MVCKVKSGKSIKGALNYNENKVKEGHAECIAAVNFITDPTDLNFYDKLNRFENLISKNTRAKTNAVHISLNFDVSEKLDQNTLNDIASAYITKIGFGDQPYLVYQHHDAAHPHVHIVTTNIKEDGKRISIHNLGKNESENARKEIELQYGLVQAQSKPAQKNLLITKPEKAVYGKHETKRSISNIVNAVIRNYKFGSLPEFNAVLKQYNIIADRGKEGMRMFEKNGLIYNLLDDQGNKIGVPIKASIITGKPTLKYLQDQFKLNQMLKTPHKQRIIKTIDSFFNVTPKHTKVNFCDYMNFYGINAAFRENKDRRVYGLTFIDNKEGAVFNGSDLGKEYSGQTLINRLEDYKTGEKEKVELGSGVPSEASYEHKPDWKIGIPSLVLDLMKTEKYYPETTQPYKKRRKKRKGQRL